MSATTIGIGRHLADRDVFSMVSSNARSAVATIIMSGPGVSPVIEEHLKRTGSGSRLQWAIGKVAYGHWRRKQIESRNASNADPKIAETNEEGVVVCKTGNEQFEVHCHGGSAAQAAIADDLRAAGFEQLSREDTIRCQTKNPIEAEATHSLMYAATDRTAAILLDQFNGALSGTVEDCIRMLDHERTADAANTIERLLNLSAVGLHLVSPFRVAIAGEPNVGKSSLINCLLGYNRSVVFDQPGTTRDVVSATTAFSGWPVELFDTAGLRAGKDQIEEQGIQKAVSLIERADLVVLVIDAVQLKQFGSGRDPTCELTVLNDYPNALLVCNKSDIQSSADLPDNTLQKLQSLSSIFTSAKTGEGIDLLAETIGERLLKHLPKSGEAVPFTKRQVHHIVAAQKLVQAKQVDQAKQQLETLVNNSDSLVNDGRTTFK